MTMFLASMPEMPPEMMDPVMGNPGGFADAMVQGDPSGGDHGSNQVWPTAEAVVADREAHDGPVDPSAGMG